MKKKKKKRTFQMKKTGQTLTKIAMNSLPHKVKKKVFREMPCGKIPDITISK